MKTEDLNVTPEVARFMDRLAAGSHETLGPLDKQRRHVLQLAVRTVLCPLCKTPLSQITACAKPWGFNEGGKEYKCPVCRVQLNLRISLIATTPWFWRIDEASREELADLWVRYSKAWATDGE